MTSVASHADAGAVAPLPTDVLPGALGRFVREAAEGLPCPPEFLAVPALVLLGAAIGTTRELRVRHGWQERPCLYAAVVADPGSRKSPALDLVMKPVELRERELSSQHRDELQAFRAGAGLYEVNFGIWKDQKRRAAVGKGDDPGEMPSEPQEPVLRQVSTSDATVEALAVLLAENPRGIAFVRDEFAAWALSMNSYRGGMGADRQTWLSLWSGARMSVNRKSRRDALVVERPFVGVAGCMPPDVLSQLSDERGREDGFVHRILFTYPDPVPLRWTEETIADETMAAYIRVYERLAALSPHVSGDPLVVELTPGGRAAFVTWVEGHYAELHAIEDRLRGPWAKLEAYCLRLALIIHETRFVEGEATSEDVDETSIGAAVALTSFFKSHARRVYARLYADPADKKAEAVLAWLRRRELAEVTARELLRHKVGGLKSRQEIEKLLQELVDRGLGSLERPGRDSLRFRLHKSVDSRHVVADPTPVATRPGIHEVDMSGAKSVPHDDSAGTRRRPVESTEPLENGMARGAAPNLSRVEAGDLSPGVKASQEAPAADDGGAAKMTSPADPTDVPWPTIEPRSAHGQIPVPGDGGYLQWARGHALTEKESRQVRLLHLNLLRVLTPSVPGTEDALFVDLATAFDAQETSSTRTDSPCRYPSHRQAGDWRTTHGLLKCRVCHPPAPGAELRTEFP